MALVRIQILIDEEDDNALDAEAAWRGVSRSECVRQMIRRNIDPELSDTDDPLFTFKYSTETEGPTDVSTHHDTYIYGGEMKP